MNAEEAFLARDVWEESYSPPGDDESRTFPDAMDLGEMPAPVEDWRALAQRDE